jgi:PAS domain S-box-containing protein
MEVRDRGYSVRTHVIAVVAVILVPALLVAGWLASRSAASERTQLENNLHQKTREIVLVVDREIVGTRNLLTALASSHFLQTGDIGAFYRQVMDVARQLKVQIVLRDAERGYALLNTNIPLGTELVSDVPHELREAREQVLQSGKPVVSNVFRSPRTKQHLVSVLVPVMRDGKAAYVLSAGIPTGQFSQILRDSQLWSDCVGAILDRKNVFVARSEKHEEFTGTPLPVVSYPPPIAKGVAKTKNRDGTPAHWFFRRSEVTGWVIGVGIPNSVLEAPSRLALASFGAAGGLLFIIAIGLSYGLGGRMSQSIGALGIDRKPTREEFRVLFEFAPNGVLVMDGEGHIALVNAQMETMFGYRREELIGNSVEMLIPERVRAGHPALRKSFSRSPRARPMGAGRDLFGQRKDGSEFPIEIGLNPIRTRAGDLVMATVVDITARKRAAERLVATIAERDDLRRRFMQAQEDERLRLARELHDQTGQSLAAVMLELKGMETLVSAPGRDRFRLLRRQLEQMGKSLHHVAWELRPASIDELGLASVLATYISEWSARLGVEADFHCGDARLDELTDEVRTTIYRVVQEALTNIAKHAQGTSIVSVVIDRADSMLRLTIEDDGAGFDTASPAGSGRERTGSELGLAGMRERLALIGGDLLIESSVGGGTTLFARIPLEQERLIA